MKRLCWCALLTVFVAACSDSTSPPASGIRVISGTSRTDTIFASAAAPFTIELLDQAGHPVPGALVEFSTQVSASDTIYRRKTLYACDPRRTTCAQYVDNGGIGVYDGVSQTTDSAGRASATVQFGLLAGVGQLKVTVPSLGEFITISYTTLPGALSHLVIDQPDTAIYVGASYTLLARAVDRMGNTRTDVVTLHGLTASVISVNVTKVQALDIGRGKILVESGDASDTAFVSVPPRGRIITFGWAPDLSSLTELTLVNTDASDKRVILHSNGNNGSASPIWTPTGDGIVYEEWAAPDFIGYLGITDTLGAHRPLFDSATFGQSIQAAVAAGSGQLYFLSGISSIGPGGVYRSSADGTGAVYLFSEAVQPAPSPDGAHVAFIDPGSDGVLEVRDMATGHVTTIASGATRPRWSPSGDYLAFIGPGQRNTQMVKSDGSGLRTFESGVVDSHVSWSPDAKWLVVSGVAGGLKLIRVADGLVLPIAGTSTLLEAAWRP